jgi:hypothetical protein
MRLFCTTICVSMLACIPQEDDWKQWIEPVEFEGSPAIELGSAVGIGTVEVPVRLVNSYKATIPGTELTVSVDGPTATLESSTVVLDAHGQGVVRVQVTGAEAFTVQVTSSADDAEIGASVTAFATEVPMPTYAMSPVSALDASIDEEPHHIAMGTDGVIVAVADELWWHPVDSSPAYRVANLPADVVGMESAHIDADGVLDLVTWAGGQVMLFRGRSGGGLSWGGGWIGDGGEVAGVAPVDLNGDRTTDLAIALTDSEQGVVQLLSGTGAWEFDTMGPPLVLEHAIYGITAADEGQDGRPDVTVIAAGHDQMRRYTMTEDSWLGASTFNLSSVDGSECEEGSRLLPMRDLDGDGQEEVTISGPSTASPHELVFFILGETVKHYPLTYETYTVDLADMNSDGATDITLLEGGTLHYVHHDGSDFKDDSINLDRVGGPIAAGDLDGDGDGDLAVVSSGVAFTHGRINDTGGWSRDIGDWNSFSTSLLTDPVVTDVDGDGIADVLGLSTDGTNVTANLWRILNDSEGTELLFIGSVVLGTATEGYGLLHCEADGYTDYYALVGDGETERVYRLKITSSSVGAYISLATDGTLFHCADTWDGSSYTPYMVVVSNTAGSWTSYRRGLTVDDSGNAGSLQEFALMTNEIVGCSEAGCSMQPVDLNGDGSPELASIDSSGLVVEWSDGREDTLYPGGGSLSLADADGDGWIDLIATDEESSRVWIYRNLGNGLAPPVGLHTTRYLGSNAHFGDVTGDDIPELIFRDVDGRIIHSDTTEADSSSSW